MVQASLGSFLQEMDTRQRDAYAQLDIFRPETGGRFDLQQKQYFLKVFYHTRGHFDRLLWTRLVYAPGVKEKHQILQYLAEEAGLSDLETEKDQPAHEILFAAFAESVGVLLTPELTEQEAYLPFARRFNQGLVAWFREHDWQSGSIAFCAYERLDNLDYAFLYELARCFSVPETALQFFIVHQQADHFEKTSADLPKQWEQDPQRVREAFAFIYEHQRQMWQGLSEAMSGFRTRSGHEFSPVRGR